MQTFNGSGYLNGVKILSCKDDPSLLRVREVVPKLQGLWKNAVLEIVYRNYILSIPKAKDLILQATIPDDVLQLPRTQNLVQFCRKKD